MAKGTHEYRDDPRNENILIFVNGELVLTDGHTRALAAHLSGRTHVAAYIDQDELDLEAYQVCVGWCREAGVHTIADLASRIMTAEEYQRLWYDKCQEMHRRLARQR